MMLTLVIVVAAVLALALVLGLALSRALGPTAGPNAEAQLQPIDVAAFRNLVDPAEDEYLRRHLSPGQFRTTQRARLRARAAYVRMAAKNAAVLVGMGQAALATGEARVQDAALRLVNDALLLRRNAAFALLRIYGDMIWPDYSTATAGIVERYQGLSDAAMLLGRLRHPAVPVRATAGLN
ncbi:MAG TPA: hypothetical protein VIW68_14205 [Candidatus Sulfotelmatobacter sp.]